MSRSGIGLAGWVACVLLAVWPQGLQASGPDKKHPRVLIVLTSHTELRGTGKKTGFWLEELATPYYLFKQEGYDIQIASVRGGRTNPDPMSMDSRTQSVKRFQEDEDAMRQVHRTEAISRLQAEDYDAVYLPGGYGAMWDMAYDSQLRRMLNGFVQEDKPIAAVGHGISALIELPGKDGSPYVKGRKVTGFTHAEEKSVKLDTIVPFYIDAQLKNAGGKVETAAPFQAHSVQDGTLITGQNYTSAEGVAQLLIKALKNRTN